MNTGQTKMKSRVIRISLCIVIMFLWTASTAAAAPRPDIDAYYSWVEKNIDAIDEDLPRIQKAASAAAKKYTTGDWKLAGAELVWSLTDYREKEVEPIREAGELFINQHWDYGDAAVEVPGYSINICPTSGYIAQAILHMFNAGLLARDLESEHTDARNHTGSEEKVRKTKTAYSGSGDDALAMNIVDVKIDSDTRRSAIVLFHGGGWKSASPELLFPHARYFARRGMVAFVPEYRLANEKTGITVTDAARDCRKAVRWVRDHADAYGIDSNKIVAAGDSAGGHLAAVTALVGKMTHETDKQAKRSRPDVLILLGSITNTAEGKWHLEGEEGKMLSPVHNIDSDEPPTLILHGEKDEVVPVQTARDFAATMEKHGNKCRLKILSDTGHAFVLPGYGTDESIRRAMKEVDDFLVQTGFLRGKADEKALRSLVKDDNDV